MRYINPRRKITETVLLYTRTEGGEVICLFGIGRTEFEKIVEKGYIECKTGDRYPEKIYPAYITLATVEDGYDFQLEKINTQNGYQKNYVPSKLSDYLKNPKSLICFFHLHLIQKLGILLIQHFWLQNNF